MLPLEVEGSHECALDHTTSLLIAIHCKITALAYQGKQQHR
jgi:hypothetical protein